MKKLNDMTLPEMLEEIKQYEGFKWPDFVQDMFPALLIFYRPTKIKIPKGKVLGYWPKDGKTKEGGLITKRKKATASAAERNNQSVLTSVAMSVDDYGTIRRCAKHRGFTQLVALVYATPEEIEIGRKAWRVLLRKYKTFRGLYRMRGLDDPRWFEICERLHADYPSLVRGPQTRSIQAGIDFQFPEKPDPDPLNLL